MKIWQLTDFHCVMCGEQITAGQAILARREGWPGVCMDHQTDVMLTMLSTLPDGARWPAYWCGNWKQDGDKFIHYVMSATGQIVALPNDGKHWRVDE